MRASFKCELASECYKGITLILQGFLVVIFIGTAE